LANVLIFPGFFKLCAKAIPTRYFEFVVAALSRLKRALQQYFVASFSFALLNSALWCLAAYLLQFDNFILMTFIMFLCAFVPRIGLFVAAVLSLLFVESGLFLIQLGGMLIALASIWFIDHTALRSHILVQTRLPVSLFIVLPILGYIAFSFSGFFLAAPFFYVMAESTQIIAKYALLIHKPARSVPRNA
jgi:predicted PurR-regulated permease PerM